MKTRTFIHPLVLALGFLSTINSPLSTCFAQGSLTPPGPPAPAMKTLAQVEPRTPISSLPYTITNAGSYYLTTNLTGLSGTNGIMITANHVVLDLAGFALSGVPGATIGVNLPSTQTNLLVRNGTIRGWNNLGVFGNCVNGQFEQLNLSDNGTAIQAGSGCRVASCTLYNNLNGIFVADGCAVKDCVCQATGVGVQAADGCTVQGCAAIGNGYSGITVGNGCSVKDCTVKANFPAGIRAGAGCTIENCTALSNTSTGIVAGAGCTLRGCTAKSNLADGINADNGSTITGCTAAQNTGAGIATGTSCAVSGCSAYFNSGAGINAGSASSVSGCAARANGGDGILVAWECRVADNGSSENGVFQANSVAGIHATGYNNRIEGNVATYNARGIDVGTTNGNNVIVRNTAAANTSTNYSIAPGNDLGPVGTAAASTSPWANISH